MPVTIPTMNPSVQSMLAQYNTAMQGAILTTLENLRNLIIMCLNTLKGLKSGASFDYYTALLNGYRNILVQRVVPMEPALSRYILSYYGLMISALDWSLDILRSNIASLPDLIAKLSGESKLDRMAVLNGYNKILAYRETFEKPPAVTTEFFLTINTTPQGQHVRIDAVYQSAPTPLKIKIGSADLPRSLAPGTHIISLAEPGFQTVSQSVTLFAGKDAVLTLPAAAVRKETNKLQITSDVPGARVFLDGKDTTRVTNTNFYVIQPGETPYPEDVTAGAHSIKISLAGYEDQTKSFAVKATGTTTADFKLSAIKPVQYKVSITANVSNARIFVDGVNTGHYTPEDMIIGTGDPKKYIAAGSHIIKLIRSKYIPQEKTVTVPPAANLAVVFELILEKEVPPPPPPPPAGPTEAQLKQWDSLLDSIDAQISTVEQQMHQAGVIK